MADRQIGDITFDVMRGSPDSPAIAVEARTRPGRDFARYRQVGQRAPSVEVRTVKYLADAAAATAAELTYKALVGTAVSITDALSRTFANCKILTVQTVTRPCLQGSANTRRLGATWLVMQNDPSG